MKLSKNYWDCECEGSYHKYIKPNSIDKCNLCKAKQIDQPNSRNNEVKIYLKLCEY